MSFSQTLSSLRRSKNARLILLAILLILLAVMYYFFEKFRGIIIGLAIVLLAAVGLEVFEYDIDLGKLWETGSVDESRVQTKNGVKLIGECIADDVNCANFDTQAEAQALYDRCAESIMSYNSQLEGQDIKSLDIYGLDGNKNGIVCEALPKGAR